MPSSQEFAQWVAECVQHSETVEPLGEVTLRAMFGEYCLYVAGRPVALICDDTCFVKTLPEIEAAMTAAGASTGYPYDGARPHWVLDPAERDLVAHVLPLLFTHSSAPRRRARRQSDTARPGR